MYKRQGAELNCIMLNPFVPTVIEIIIVFAGTANQMSSGAFNKNNNSGVCTRSEMMTSIISEIGVEH